MILLKHCGKCNLSVSGSPKRCPLCQGSLSGEGTAEVYPVIDTVYHRHEKYLKQIIFLFVCAIVISISINLMLPDTGAWSAAVTVGIGGVWLWLVVAIRLRRNILKQVLDQVIVLSLLAILWDWFMGWHGWSVNFVVPGLFICAMLTSSILARVLKIASGDYLVYLCVLIIFGVIPMAFLLMDIATIPYLAYVCLICSLLSLARLIIFERAILSDELKRRLHL